MEKPFKPIVIPRKLQQALPYRDKPKNGVKFDEVKKSLDRVAVIREPEEEKVAKMMKMIKTAYDHKQKKLKAEMKERMDQHRKVITAQEQGKDRNIRKKKKEVFRNRSKAQIRQEKRTKK